MAAGGVRRECQAGHVGDPVEQRPPEGLAERAAAQAHRLQLLQCFPPLAQAGIGGLTAGRIDPAHYLHPDSVDQFRAGRDGLGQQQQHDESAEGEQQRKRIVLGTQQKCATQTKQRQSHHLQCTGHHQLPRGHHRRGAPLALLAVDERGRQHRAAGQRGAQRIAGVKHRLRTPLADGDSRGPQQRSLNLGETVHRQHRGSDRRQYPPQVGRQQTRPCLGQLIPHQAGLDHQHDDRHRKHGPPHPPVPAPGCGAALLVGTVGQRVVGHVFQGNRRLG